MTQTHDPADLAAGQVLETLSRTRGSQRRISGDAVRSAALMAAQGARRIGGGAGRLAQGAAEGAVRAAGEIGGETAAFVRDAVIGVVEGTGRVVRITGPAIREMVTGAVRGANRASAEITVAGQNAVEGAIVGASALGVDTAEAASAAADGAIEAVIEAGGNLTDAARAAIGGVVSGVSAAGGDVAAAVRESTLRLIDHTGGSEEVAAVTGDVVDTVLAGAEASDWDEAEVARLVSAAAVGTVTAAYQVGQPQGDLVREQVVRQIARPRLHLSPGLQGQLAEVSERLSRELPRVRAAWRWTAFCWGVRFLLKAGATDQAASLAYYTVLSFFPLMALTIIISAFFVEPSIVTPILVDLAAYYLPASSDVVGQSIEGLLGNSAALGLLALSGLALSASGLFMAANRAVNRVFDVHNHKSLTGNIAEALLTVVLGIVLLALVGVGAFFHVVLGVGGESLLSEGAPSQVGYVVLGALAAVLPAGVTGVVFTVMYHNLPQLDVKWKDAAFGGVISLLLFESGKHLFFWLSGMAASRFLVYGPVASTVVLLMWAFAAALVFLFGAALTRAAGELRHKVAPASGPASASGKGASLREQEEE